MTARWRGLTGGRAARVAFDNGDVTRIVAGFGSVTLGEWVLGTAVAIAAYGAGGALAVALVGFRFVPGAIAGVLLSGLQGRIARARILTVVGAGRAACAAGAALAFHADAAFGVVLAFVWLDSMIGSAYRPAQAALLPALVRSPSELTASTTVLSNAKSTSQILGALGGGVLFAAASAETAVGVAAVLYLVAASMTVPLARREQHPRPTSRSRRTNLEAIGAAADLLRHDTVAARIVGYSGLRSLLRGAWVALAVVASIEVLDMGEAGFGILMAAAGVGAILAIPVSAALAFRPRLARSLAISLVLSGVAVCLVGVTGAAAAAAALMICWGGAMSLADVTASALLYRVVRGRHIPEVTGFMESTKLLLEGLGALVAPALVATLSVRDAVVVVGAAVPVVVGLDARAFPRIDHRAITHADLMNLVHGVPLFAPLRVESLEAIVAQLTPQDVAAGEVVIQEGDRDAHDYFLIESGAFEVLIDAYLVAALGPGQGFGELALLRDVPRAATVRATEASRVLRLSRGAFLSAIGGPGAVAVPSLGPATADPLEALARLPLLHGVAREPLTVLARGGTVVEHPEGSTITEAGATEDTCHLVLSGKVMVMVDGDPRRVLHPGDLFGEIAVLHRRPRLASVVATEDTVVLTIAGDALRVCLAGREDPVGALATLA